MPRERVLITGASGYISSHCIRLLLDKGYVVRGTVRDLDNKQKVVPLKVLAEGNEDSLELVKADLLDSECWDDIVKDCDFVLHIASPCPSDHPDDENVLIKPALEGTANIMNACYKESRIKRVVITSSLIAICGDQFDKEDSYLFDESDWPEIQNSNPYCKSKTLAEKAAWDFMKVNPKNGNTLPTFELCTINPGFIFGPVICNNPGASANLLKKIMTKQVPMIPDIDIPMVDVRDVAMMHYKVMISSEAKGHRHLVVSNNMWFKDIATVVSDEFSPLGYQIPISHMPYFIMWMLSWLPIKKAKERLKAVGKVANLDTSRMKAILENEPINSKTSIIDTIYSLIEIGTIERTEQYNSLHPL